MPLKRYIMIVFLLNSSALKQSIKYKNKLYIRSRRTPTFANIKQYKEYRHLLNKLLCKTERDYYDFLLYQNKNNLRKSWSIIKSIINKGNNSALSDKFLINNNISTNKEQIANAFM